MAEIVTLKYPIRTKEGGSITELTLPRPVAKDLRKLPEAVLLGEQRNPVAFLPMLSSVSGVSEETLEGLDAEDLIDIVTNKLMPFLSGSRPTGATL